MTASEVAAGLKRGMTVTEYAAHRGCSRQGVYKAIAEGRIAREADGSIDPARADQQWQANTMPTLRWPAGNWDVALSEADLEWLLR